METKANIIYTVKGSDKYWTGAAGEGVTAFVRQSLVDPVVTALEPFAKFACDTPHENEPDCLNCVARAALAAYHAGVKNEYRAKGSS